MRSARSRGCSPGVRRTTSLLHQHQRTIHWVERTGGVIEYLDVEPRGIEVADRLAGEVLGRSLGELPPQTRRVLSLLDACARE